MIWTRLLSLHFGATVYTFALILAVFLVGLGIGSTVGATLARDIVSPKRALGWCQLLLCGAIAWAAYELTESLPYWPINPYISTTPWFTLQLDLVRCFWVVLPGAMLWGASFPLALAAVATTEQDAARLAGGVYAANTVGAIAGSLVTSFILIPWIGTSHAEQVIIIVSALSALIMLEPSFAGAPARPAGFIPDEAGEKRGWNVTATVVLAVAMIAAGLLARSVHPLPGLLVAYGRYAATRIGQADIIYVGEGLNASVAVSELSNGVRNYHNAGKVQASSEPQDMRLQRMLGHLTTLIPPQAKKVLVIGCGAGVTAGRGVGRPGRRARDDRGDRAAGAEGRLHLFRRAQLRRGPEPEGARADRRRAAFRRDDAREVRRDHLRPARSVGEGRGDALHRRVLHRWRRTT